jgi:tetratricopeptide (TPR) repeat protein
MKVRSSFLPVLPSAFLAVLALSHPAVAAEKGEMSKDQENAARAACLMGDYQRGAEILVKLFIQTRDSTYLYNQGRCYQQNHRWEEALDRFREYLRKNPKLADSTKAEVQQHIAECEAKQSKAEVTPPSPPEPKTAPPGGAPPETPQAGKAAVAAEAVPAAAQPAPAATIGTPVPPPAPAPLPAEDPSASRADLIQTAPDPGQAQPESSIFSRWWFWTAAGVLVAGGITAGLLLSRGSNTSIKPFTCPDCDSTPSGVNAP